MKSVDLLKRLIDRTPQLLELLETAKKFEPVLERILEHLRDLEDNPPSPPVPKP